MINHIYLSEFHGCAYALDGNVLITTPLNEDLTYDTCLDNWVEVDYYELRDIGEEHEAHVDWVLAHLTRMEEPQDTPLAEMYGG